MILLTTLIRLVRETSTSNSAEVGQKRFYLCVNTTDSPKSQQNVGMGKYSNQSEWAFSSRYVMEWKNMQSQAITWDVILCGKKYSFRYNFLSYFSSHIGLFILGSFMRRGYLYTEESQIGHLIKLFLRRRVGDFQFFSVTKSLKFLQLGQ